MDKPTPPAHQPSSQAIAATVISHLAAETALMRDSIVVLTDMRAALSRNETDNLLAALEKQQVIANSTQGLRKQRQILKQHIARAFDTSLESASISFFAQRLDAPLRDQVLTSRQTLMTLHREADAINQGIAALASQSLAIMQYCVGGKKPTQGCTRYSADGAMEPKQANSTMEARV